MIDDYEVIIVGAGITGLTLAERFANVAKKKVLVIEKRDHIGGNCFDFLDEHGVLVSKYGPHVFHSSNKKVVDYIQKFAKWEKYEHQVSSLVKGKLVPIPVNIETINNIFGIEIKNGEEMKNWLDKKRVKKIKIPKNSEEVVLSKLGREIFGLMFRDFTKKQWDLWPKELVPELLARIPVRYSFERRYHTDKYQLRPIGGYTKIMEVMIKNPKITIKLKTDYFKVAKNLCSEALIIFTGPVDQFTSFKTGKDYKLPYRSVRFKLKSYHKEYHQPVGVINYPSFENRELRSTEYKYLTGQKNGWTTVSKEYYQWEGEPFYPVKSLKSREEYKEIKIITQKWKNIYFAGRLGKYKYIDMDEAINEALKLFEEINNNEKK